MATCLLALGSNLGDREQTLLAAFSELGAMRAARVVGQSGWHRFAPVGGPAGQGEFLNAALLLDTALPPGQLFENLERIEMRHGRLRRERWAARTLDIDLLLYDDRIIDSPQLTIPHPRMSFRRFVLRPAVEIAPRMVHPAIGWTLEQLSVHLDIAPDRAAVVSPSNNERRELCELVIARHGGRVITPPPEAAEADGRRLWPPQLTTWLEFPGRAPESAANYPAGGLPKLSILLDAKAADDAEPVGHWSMTRRLAGRGPSLLVQAGDRAEIAQEVTAAIEAVWPDLGPSQGERVE
jgi:2-amino-4-hydroxy-6-hydroxymethyldihydropteridine diphosphokinase